MIPAILVIVIALFIINASIMATLEELQASITRLSAAQETTNTAIAGIAGDIVRIKESLPPAGAITQEQLDTLAADLSAVAERAEAIAASAAALDAENWIMVSKTGRVYAG